MSGLVASDTPVCLRQDHNYRDVIAETVEWLSEINVTIHVNMF